MFRFFLIAVAAYLLSGCATGPAFTEIAPPRSDEEAVVYIFRPSKWVGSAAYPRFTLNRGDCHVLRNGAYYRSPVKAGVQEVAIVPGRWKGHYWRETNLIFDAPAGSTVFIRYTTRLESLMMYPGGFADVDFEKRFAKVDVNVATSEMASTHEQSLDQGCD